jgi:hypothetical protein
MLCFFASASIRMHSTDLRGLVLWVVERAGVGGKDGADFGCAVGQNWRGDAVLGVRLLGAAASGCAAFGAAWWDAFF